MGHPHIDTGSPDSGRDFEKPEGMSTEEHEQALFERGQARLDAELRDAENAAMLSEEIKAREKNGKGKKIAKDVAGVAFGVGTAGAVDLAGRTLGAAREGVSEVRKGVEDWGSAEMKKHMGWVKYIPFAGKWLLGKDPKNKTLKWLLGSKESVGEREEKFQKEQKAKRKTSKAKSKRTKKFKKAGFSEKQAKAMAGEFEDDDKDSGSTAAPPPAPPAPPAT